VENLTPGQFSAPLVSITPPAALPDPTGLAGTLAAVQNGNLFRDMTGERSIYDELLVVRPPKRVVGGVRVRF